MLGKSKEIIEFYRKLLSFVQSPPYSQKHGDETGRSSDKIRYRLCKEYSVCTKTGYGRKP